MKCRGRSGSDPGRRKTLRGSRVRISPLVQAVDVENLIIDLEKEFDIGNQNRINLVHVFEP
jgi:hypothetical protein